MYSQIAPILDIDEQSRGSSPRTRPKDAYLHTQFLENAFCRIVQFLRQDRVQSRLRRHSELRNRTEIRSLIAISVQGNFS